MKNDDNQETASAHVLVHGHLTDKAIEAALYVVATPIGNLGDITLRALNVLQNADAIACEDTQKQSPHIMAMLGEGKSVALVSDAGTPLVSDPGYRLIKDAIANEYKVVPLPGASWAQTPATLIFFESPRRIAATLQDAAHVLGGERQAVVARELTKLFETFRRASLEELAAHYAKEPTPKGEIVLLIEPAKQQGVDIESVDAELLDLLKTLRVKDASEQLSRETGLPKRDLYQRALALKEQLKDG